MDLGFLPLGRVLPTLRPYLSGVDAAAWRGLESLAVQLPPAWSRGCFELRLTAGDERVDLLVWAVEDAGKRALSAALSAGRLPGGERLRPLIEEWIEPGTPLSTLPAVWLEYDLAEDGIQVPFAAFGLQSVHGAGARSLPPGDLRRLVQRARRLLSGKPDDEEQLAAIERCVRALPAEARLTYFASYLPARQSEDVRLLALLPVETVWSWLSAIGWPGERRHWETVRAALGADYPCVQLNVDVGPAVRPRLGVEFQLPVSLAMARPWSEFLQRIVELGGAAAERCGTVLDWMGSHTFRPVEDPWPVRVNRRAVVKIDIGPEASLSSKAYLFFNVLRTLC